MGKQPGEKSYVVLEIKIGKIAIPIENVSRIEPIFPNAPRTTIPFSPECVKGVVMSAGDYITVVELPEPEIKANNSYKLIAILAHKGKKIGILAQEAHTVSVPDKDIAKDSTTGDMSIIYNGESYCIFDIETFFKRHISGDKTDI